MAKDPAFLFYSSDFLAGVSDLTMEERGQYITLLCLQHQKSGRLSRKAVAIAVPNAAADVMAKFKEDENGLLYNERLEKESIKRREHSEKQRQRAVEGWKKRKAKNDTTAYAAALPLGNENEIENIIEYLNKTTNSNYRASTKKTQTLIKARLNEKFTIEDFKTVIDNKSKQWLGNKDFEQYLRPETLFGTKFEGYLNEKQSKGDERQIERTPEHIRKSLGIG